MFIFEQEAEKLTETRGPLLESCRGTSFSTRRGKHKIRGDIIVLSERGAGETDRSTKSDIKDFERLDIDQLDSANNCRISPR